MQHNHSPSSVSLSSMKISTPNERLMQKQPTFMTPSIANNNNNVSANNNNNSETDLNISIDQVQMMLNNNNSDGNNMFTTGNNNSNNNGNHHSGHTSLLQGAKQIGKVFDSLVGRKDSFDPKEAAGRNGVGNESNFASGAVGQSLGNNAKNLQLGRQPRAIVKRNLFVNSNQFDN